MGSYKYKYLITFNGKSTQELFYGDSDIIVDGVVIIRRHEDNGELHEAYFIPVSSINWWFKKLNNGQ